MGAIVSQYKDPYKPMSIMESRKVFWAVAHVSYVNSPGCLGRMTICQVTT